MKKLPAATLGFSLLAFVVSYVISYLLLVMPGETVGVTITDGGWDTHAVGKRDVAYHGSNPAIHAFFTPIHKIDRLVRNQYWEGGVVTRTPVTR